MKITIKHNPYSNKTEVLLDGNLNEKISSDFGTQAYYQIYENMLEKILTEFGISGESINVEFVGIVEHFEAMQSTIAEVSNKFDVKIQFKHLPIRKPSDLLEEVRLGFKAFCNTDWHGADIGLEDLKEEFKETDDTDADINVIATMSSGKSTLINSMIGAEILPAANEATTATVLRFFDTENTDRIIAHRIGENNKILAENIDITDNASEILKEWNSAPATKEVHLYGELHGIHSQKHSRLVLVDTPGPNNSQDASHQETTHQILQDVNKSVVLYVLNAGQLRTNDDAELLKQVREAMELDVQSHDRFIFVLNQIDRFDPKKGESVPSALDRMRIYLEKTIGIKKPNIYPVSAMAAMVLRKQLENQELTEDEEGDLFKFTRKFTNNESMHLAQYMPLSPHVEDIINAELAAAKSDEEKALIHSGVPIVEEVINEYLEKYALPQRVGSLLKIFGKMIGTVKANINAQLEALNNPGEEIIEQINIMKSQISQIEEVGKDVLREAIDIPVIDDKLTSKIFESKKKDSKKISDIIAKLENYGDFVNKNDGIQYLKQAQTKIKDVFAQSTTTFKNLAREKNEEDIELLKASFINKTKELFGSSGDNLFSGLLLQGIENTNFNPSFVEVEAKVISSEEQVLKTRFEEKRVWYKLWLGTETVEVNYWDTETIHTINCHEEGVNLLQICEEDLDGFMGAVETKFKENRSKLIESLEKTTLDMINQRCSSIEEQMTKIVKLDQNEREDKILKLTDVMKKTDELTNKVNSDARCQKV